MIQFLILIVIATSIFCIGGFLWSIVEEDPKPMWLIGVAITILVGVAGLAVHYH